MNEGRVIYYLEIWQNWMKNRKDHKLGYPTKSAGFFTGGIHSTEDFEEEGDYYAAGIVNTAIKDLKKEIPACGQAIHARWLGDKCDLTPLAIDMYYNLALEKLDVRLKNKGLY